MKRFKNIQTVFVAMGLAFVFYACNCDDDGPTPPDCTDPTNPDCPNYDPCFGENPVTAEFRIYDDVFSGGPFAGTWHEDSVLWGGNIKFEAVEDSAYYKWYVGQEVIEGYGDSLLTRGINNLNPGTYDASLVVKKTPNQICFPYDNGCDSIYKTFTIVDRCDLLVINKFKGVFESAPNDSLVIEFLFINPNTKEPDCSSFEIGGINLSGEQDTILISNQKGITNRYLEFAGYEYASPIGSFEVLPNNTYYAKYILRGENYVFNGKLLQ